MLNLICNWSANQRNYSTSWQLEQEKTFIKLTLIGKVEDACGKQLFGSVLNYANDTVPEMIVTMKS